MPLNPPLGDATDIWIDTDERGFELHFETEQGRFHVNIHGCSLTLLEQVDKQLRPYWQEAEDARRTYVPPAGGMTSEEIEDVYKHDRGKLQAMRERWLERGAGGRPW